MEWLRSFRSFRPRRGTCLVLCLFRVSYLSPKDYRLA